MIQVKELVCKEFGVTIPEMMSKNRQRRIVDSRRAYSAIMREYYNRTLEHIGTDLNKDHSTIMHQISGHKELFNYDKHYRQSFNNCIDSIEVVDEHGILSAKVNMLSQLNKDLHKVKQQIIDTKKELKLIIKRKEEILSNSIE